MRQAVVAEGEKRSRCHSAPGGRAGYSVSGQRGRVERPHRHRVQDVPGSMLRERGRSNGRGRSALPRIRWRNQEQARAHRRSRTARSPVRACVGSVPAQSGSDEGLAPRCSWRRTYGTVERSRARKSRARMAGRECVLPGPGPSHLEGAVAAALQLQKGARKHGSSRGTLEREASRLLSQMRGK